jgi:hypothetical protein
MTRPLPETTGSRDMLSLLKRTNGGSCLDKLFVATRESVATPVSRMFHVEFAFRVLCICY